LVCNGRVVRLKRRLSSLAVVAILSAACGSVAPTSPSPAPSPSLPSTLPWPSLVGPWRGLVGGQVINVPTGERLDFGLVFCSQNWEFSTQTDGSFTGGMAWRGQSPDSDWRCTHSTSFSGQLQRDDSLSIRFDTAFRPGGCTDVVRPEVLTGRMTASDTITIEFTGRATCELLRGVEGQPRDVEFQITFNLTRR
jgi:hypothetical protein